jgi:signal peptidase
MARIISRICSIVFAVVLIVIVIFAGSMLIAQVLGYKPLAILSGSMEPNYHVNGLIFVDTNVEAETLEVGDVVSFKRDETTETVITHRIVEIDKSARTLTTKGDANNTIDGEIDFDNVVGKEALYIPKAGGFMLMARSTKGIAVGLLILAFLIILYVIPILLGTKPGKTDAEPEEALDEQESPPEATDEQGNLIEATDGQDSSLEVTEEQDSLPEATDEQESSPEVTEEQDSPLEATDEPVSSLEATDEQDSPLEAMDEQGNLIEATDEQDSSIATTDELLSWLKDN